MAEVNQELQLREQLTTVQFQNIQIVDQKTYDHAAEALVQIKTWRKRWAEYWDEPRANAHKAWQTILGKFNDGDKSAAASEAIVKQKILSWDMEQERLRRIEQERLEREAREKEEAERTAKAAEMDVMGVSDDDIEEYLEAPPTAVAPVVAPTYIRSSAISTRANWVCVVTDLKALCKAIGAGKLKLNDDDQAKAVEFFEGLLKKRATADTSTMNVPGCKAENRPVVAGRTR